MLSHKLKFKLLAIETSCDETAAAVLEGDKKKFEILSNAVFSQIKIHKKYGGVFPELASREHIRKIQLIINQALKESKLKNLNSIDAIAVTNGPGLIGSLLVGVNTATALSYAFKKPLISVNHLEGHIYSNFISHTRCVQQLHTGCVPAFPLLALIVSGGHTELVYMSKHLDYKVLGQTLDDAAGEAFDKVAKLLGLGYPGGPAIATEAAKFKKSHNRYISSHSDPDVSSEEESVANATSGIRRRSFATLSSSLSDKVVRPQSRRQDNIRLPRPMLNSKDFNFSFSGLKTAVLYEMQKHKKITPALKTQIAYEFQEAITDVLVQKTLKAASKYQVNSLLLGGGVAANFRLREKLKENLARLPNPPAVSLSNPPKLFITPIQFCTDNAAMIAIAAYYKYLADRFTKWYDVIAKPNASL